MIGKLIKGTDAAGLLAYVTAPDDSNGAEREVVVRLGGTIPGDSTAEMLPHFEMLATLRPTLGVRVAHAMLRWTTADQPSLTDQAEMAERHAAALGFQHWVAFSHGNHLHIAASRINGDGTLVSDACDWKRAEKSVRDLEAQFGLVQIESSHLLDSSKRDTHKFAPTSAELGAARRGKPSARVQLQLAVDAALSECPTFADFVGRLHAEGVEVRPNIQATGRVAGVSFSLDGFEFKASRLGKGYAWNALQRRGLDYDNERDGDLARSCVHRCEARRDSLRNGSVARGNGSNFDGNSQNDREPSTNVVAVYRVDRHSDHGNAEHVVGIDPGGTLGTKRNSNDSGEFAPVPQKIGGRSRDEARTADDRAILPQLRNSAAGDESRQLRVSDRSETAPVPPVAGGHGGIRGLALADNYNPRPVASGAGGRPGSFVGSLPSVDGIVEVIDGTETADEALRKWSRNMARALRGLQGGTAAHSGANDPPPPTPNSLAQSLARLSALADTLAGKNAERRLKSDPETPPVRPAAPAVAAAVQVEVAHKLPTLRPR